jgi:hypothetical protein
VHTRSTSTNQFNAAKKGGQVCGAPTLPAIFRLEIGIGYLYKTALDCTYGLENTTYFMVLKMATTSSSGFPILKVGSNCWYKNSNMNRKSLLEGAASVFGDICLVYLHSFKATLLTLNRGLQKCCVMLW